MKKKLLVMAMACTLLLSVATPVFAAAYDTGEGYGPYGGHHKYGWTSSLIGYRMYYSYFRLDNYNHYSTVHCYEKFDAKGTRYVSGTVGPGLWAQVNSPSSTGWSNATYGAFK